MLQNKSNMMKSILLEKKIYVKEEITMTNSRGRRRIMRRRREDETEEEEEKEKKNEIP